MPLAKVRDLLADAQKQNTSVLAFDAFDYNTIFACIQGAEKAGKPVILMLYPTMRGLISFGAFAGIARDLAASARVPVGLHLDHCSEPDVIFAAIRAGFTSVMADGSTLPLEENIAFTKKIVDVARCFDVDVEGEVGHVGQVAAGDDYHDSDSFTRPDEALRFARETGVASMAVAFGSCHGLYKSAPHLDLARLQEIDRAVETPLVLHGGSGIPADQLEQAFCLGINKFNVGTEFFLLDMRLTQEYFAQDAAARKPFGDAAYIRAGLTDYIAQKLQLCKL